MQAPKTCKCGPANGPIMVNKEGPNQGKLFYSCGKGGLSKGGCNFFAWADASDTPKGAAAPVIAPGGRASAPWTQPQVKRTVKVTLTMQQDGGAKATFAYRPDLVDLCKLRRGTWLPAEKAWLMPPSALSYDGMVKDLLAIPDVICSQVPAASGSNATSAAASSPSSPPKSSAASAPAPSPSMTPQCSSAASSASGATSASVSSSSAAPSEPQGEVSVNVNQRTWSEVLHSFQRAGVQWILRKKDPGRALLADEMGLGKTTTSMIAAAHFRYSWPMLVICPSALRLNWRDELLARLTDDGLDPSSIHIIASGKDPLPPRVEYAPPEGMTLQRAQELGYTSPRPAAAAPGAASGSGTGVPPQPPPLGPPHPGVNAGVVVISYEIAATYAEKGLLRPGQFGCVIADECHSLKSQEAKRTKRIVPLLQRARYALLLSGTPALNRPKELFTQISAVNPRLFPSYVAYAERYCAAHMAPWGWVDTGSSHLGELNATLEREIMLRRLKVNVLSDLPPKQREIVPVRLPPGAVERLAGLRKELASITAKMRNAASETDRQLCSLQQRGLLAQLYRTTGIGKVEAVTAHILAMILPDPRAVPARWASASAAGAAGRGRGRGRGGAAGASAGAKRKRGAGVQYTSDDEDNGAKDSASSDSDSNDEINSGAVRKPPARRGNVIESDSDDGDDSGSVEGGGFIIEAPAATAAPSAATPAASAGAPAAAATDAAAVPGAAARPMYTLPSGRSFPRVRKLLVFAHHSEVLEHLQTALARHDPPIKTVRIDGKTLPERKHELKEAFQAPDSDVQVALVGITAAGVGLSFTQANTAVFAELHWTPGIIFQAEDRIHRIGQKASEVHIHYCNSGGGGVDSELLEMLRRKRENIAEALDTAILANKGAGGSGGRGAGARAGGGSKKRGAASSDGEDEDEFDPYANIGDEDAVPEITGLFTDDGLEDGGGAISGSSIATGAGAGAGAGGAGAPQAGIRQVNRAAANERAMRAFFSNTAVSPSQGQLQFQPRTASGGGAASAAAAVSGAASSGSSSAPPAPAASAAKGVGSASLPPKPGPAPVAVSGSGSVSAPPATGGPVANAVGSIAATTGAVLTGQAAAEADLQGEDLGWMMEI